MIVANESAALCGYHRGRLRPLKAGGVLRNATSRARAFGREPRLGLDAFVFKAPRRRSDDPMGSGRVVWYAENLSDERGLVRSFHSRSTLGSASSVYSNTEDKIDDTDLRLVRCLALKPQALFIPIARR
jgi:hypothetical protein